MSISILNSVTFHAFAALRLYGSVKVCNNSVATSKVLFRDDFKIIPTQHLNVHKMHVFYKMHLHLN